MSKEEDDPTDPAMPTPITHLKPMGLAARKLVFGDFTFEHAPQPGNPEHVLIDATWQANALVSITIPQLPGKLIRLHKRCLWQFCALWRAWEEHGLLPRVVSFDGAWAPRYVRHMGSESERLERIHRGLVGLSNHAWGTAFDINAARNPLGHASLPDSVIGSTTALVPLAQKWGFAWGGFFSNPDAMHFEVAQVIPQPAVT